MNAPPFSFFVSLLREISLHCRPLSKSKRSPSLPVTILDKWIVRLRTEFAPLPEGTTAIFFRMLFPEEDPRRKYDMQETRLASAVAECFGTSAKPLLQWGAKYSSGCLGEEVLKVLEKCSSCSPDYISPLSIAEVDNLLEELAAHSAYSDITVRAKYPHANRRVKSTIIRLLYRSLAPLDAAFLTQIILKDLRPMLYPLTDSHYMMALKSHNSFSATQLSKEDAMKAWDPSRRMLSIYRVRSRLDDAAAAFDANITDTVTPQIGTPVEIPKSAKGRGCLRALEMLRSSKEVWAETKYDGERAQIHIEILADNRPRITIFSKSKRDSTWDRYGIHSVIRESLGLIEDSGSGQFHVPSDRIKCNAILDAEMVAWHGDKIDEFWRIHGLVEHSAHGARRVDKEREKDSNYTQASLMTDVSDETRHLGVVYFDILSLNSTSLLSVPYSSRRAILQSVIKPIPTRAILADRKPLAWKFDPRDDVPTLHRVFAQCLASAEEGLVLKAAEAGYNDRRLPWVKLKKDYIPGYGDCVDLVVLGVSWDKDRARELQVPPSVYTTFYIGGLRNQEQMKRDSSARPQFYIYFTASYGLSRDQLEEANFLIKNSDPIPYHPSNTPSNSLFTYTMRPGLAPPAMLLSEPLLCELFGAGFTKSPGGRHYELRFPRITKLHRTGERSWREGITLQELHKIARDCMGKDRTNKDLDDWSNQLWGKPVSPGAALKRKSEVDVWEEKLLASDRKLAKKKGWTDFTSRTSLNQVVNASVSQASQSRPLGFGTNLVLPNAPHGYATQASTGHSPPRLRQSPTNPSPFLAAAHADRQSPVIPIEDQEPLHHVLEDSLVFLATLNPTLRHKWKTTIPPERIVHSLESLFVACGWGSGDTSTYSSSPWVQRGVILLAVDESAAHRNHILDAMRERKALYTMRPGHKAIWLLERHGTETGE